MARPGCAWQRLPTCLTVRQGPKTPNAPLCCAQVAQAAARAPAAAEGVGQYLLLLPVIQALAEFERLLGSAANATCAAGLRKFTAELLAPHSARLVAELNASAGLRPARAAINSQSDFLGRLSKVPNPRPKPCAAGPGLLPVRAQGAWHTCMAAGLCDTGLGCRR